MAPRKKAPAIESYQHEREKRVNVPEIGLVTPATDPNGETPGRYEFDPHLDPSLHWAGKAERTSFEVPTVSLHVHERFEPRTILEAVRKENGKGPAQPSLFGGDERPMREAIEFYRHRDRWSNRLIAGDSLLVMNSLLEKESMAGQVQMVYMDPPYGIRYGSNFQPFAGRPAATDGKDDDLTREPEQLRAFRDTWELGIHSYLSYLRDRLLLARELLRESGSLFLQIGDENVHRAGLLLDDIFGADNRIATITFNTAGGSSTGLLPEVGDYLLWYARDKKQVKYRQPYEALTRAEVVQLFNWDAMVELSDGTTRRLTNDERRDPDAHLPEDAKLYARQPLFSQGWSATRSNPYEWRGRSIPCPETLQWRVSGQGMDRLSELGRLEMADSWLRWKWYENEVPGRRVNNIWHRRMQAQRKRFVVETATSVIQRCLLMTSDPGDLVLDPTCGSGTTAFVAEQWGRRWITCDTSRVALVLAKQRLATAYFDYYRLARPDDGVGAGFIYKTVPKVSAKTLAYDEPAAPTTLYDQPETDSGKRRVTGPFTYEAVPAPRVGPLAEPPAADPAVVEAPASDPSVARSGETHRKATWLDELSRAGIRGKAGQRLHFTRLAPLQGSRYLHADGETAREHAAESTEDEPFTELKAAEPVAPYGAGQRVVVCFGPEHAPLDKRQVKRALDEAEHLRPTPRLLVFAAFAFDPEATREIEETNWRGVTVLSAHMNTDLQTGDLKKKQKSADSFFLIGQPDVSVDLATESAAANGSDPQFQVTLHGFDYFDMTTGLPRPGSSQQIACWMLDPDYDGRSLYPRQLFFPVKEGRDGWNRLAKNLRAQIDPERMRAYLGTTSLPFTAGEHRRIAVKVVDDRGIESLRVLDLPDPDSE